MDPFMGPGRYVNYLGDDEIGDPMPAAYGPNYRRLQEIKTKYDADNFFHLNQNIRPYASSIRLFRHERESQAVVPDRAIWRCSR